MPDLRIGISGWRYEPWRGDFYPEGLPQNKELAYVGSKFNSIEINGSFYSLQSPSSYQAWYDATPKDFVFAVKGSRYITHMRRLKEIDTPLANFFASGIFLLKEKLGPFLWQFPPMMPFKPARFEAFFKLLPRTTVQAARLAKKCDSRMKGRKHLTADEDRSLLHAIEIRHKSFVTSEFIDLLRKYRIALVVADTVGKWPYLEDVTTDFMYLRLHGDEEIYTSGYDDKALERWKKRIKLWASGRQPKDASLASQTRFLTLPKAIYVYFDNDKKVRAPFDALTLMDKLGVTWDKSLSSKFARK